MLRLDRLNVGEIAAERRLGAEHAGLRRSELGQHVLDLLLADRAGSRARRGERRLERLEYLKDADILAGSDDETVAGRRRAVDADIHAADGQAGAGREAARGDDAAGRGEAGGAGAAGAAGDAIGHAAVRAGGAEGHDELGPSQLLGLKLAGAGDAAGDRIGMAGIRSRCGDREAAVAAGDVHEDALPRDGHRHRQRRRDLQRAGAAIAGEHHLAAGLDSEWRRRRSRAAEQILAVGGLRIADLDQLLQGALHRRGQRLAVVVADRAVRGLDRGSLDLGEDGADALQRPETVLDRLYAALRIGAVDRQVIDLSLEAERRASAGRIVERALHGLAAGDLLVQRVDIALLVHHVGERAEEKFAGADAHLASAAYCIAAIRLVKRLCTVAMIWAEA